MNKSTSRRKPDLVLNHVLERMERLIIIHTQELDYLSVGDMQKFQSIQPEKLRLARDCETGIEEISSRQEEMNACDTILKQRLLSTHDTLRDLAIQSKNACQSRANSMKRIQDRLLQAARHVVKKREQKTYGRNGQTTDSYNRPIATAINEAI